jgi:ribosomal protein L12E/L44/L45/RPP1/RPP2
MDMESGEERVKAVLNEINGLNLERSVGACCARSSIAVPGAAGEPPRPSVFVCRN